jgi:hypothetical protein
MSVVPRNCWLRRTVAIAAAVLLLFAGDVVIKPAKAAFVAVSAGVPDYYYAPALACANYFPYGCYGYPVPNYAPAAVVAGGWSWGGWGWGRPCWGCGRFFDGGRFFFRSGRFFHDDRFFFRDGRFFHDGRFFFRNGRFFHDGGFFHRGFGGLGFAQRGFGNPGMMRGGFGGPGMLRGGFGGRR